ncbi:hypothetical protein [Methylobacterium sp. JK268]
MAHVTLTEAETFGKGRTGVVPGGPPIPVVIKRIVPPRRDTTRQD